MTLEQLQVRRWMHHAGQLCPNSPIIPHPHVRELRIRLIAEELKETAKALGFELTYIIDPWIGPTDLIEVADGCADLKVVVLGTEVACGLDGEPFFQEVMRSNNTKLVKDGNGHFTVLKNHLGKILKPSTYEPPNLTPMLEAQLATPLSSELA